MPIYEYFCPDCKRKFELLRPMSQAGEGALCPSCGACAQRALSVFSRSFEGPSTSEARSACSTCSSGTCGSCSLS